MTTNGQHLTGFYVDECQAQNRREMVRMKGHVARKAKELLDVVMDEGQSEADAVAHVEAVLREFVSRRGRTALQLVEISVEMVRNASIEAAERPDARRQAQQWIEQNGWPTGARFVRGTHGGSYVYDPLGTEPVPVPRRSWPYRRPSFDEIVEEVAKRGAAQTA